MDFQEIIKNSFVNLGRNKQRTFLSMLGIIIGIASVIILLSVGNGAQASITNSITSLGSNILTISPNFQRAGGVQSSSSLESLSLADTQAIKDLKSTLNLSAISPEFSSRGQIIGNGNNENVSVTGVTEDYPTAHNFTIQYGSFITNEQDTSLAKVAVIGPETATTLFGDPSSAVGNTIKINKVIFRIIGVTQSKGSSGFLNSDDFVWVPLGTAQKILFGQSSLSSIVVQASNPNELDNIKTELTNLLMNRHNISNPNNADFAIRSSADTLSALDSVTGTLTALLASIAGISLIVGGIGVMNIMIVTVTERTREIGLRKAIGANNTDILNQFLIEAVVLTLSGGLIGVTTGVVISLIIGLTGIIQTAITPGSIILSVAVTVVIGLVFGIYPARQASKLSPIDALKFE